jgi:hypothetical protein
VPGLLETTLSGLHAVAKVSADEFDAAVGSLRAAAAPQPLPSNAACADELCTHRT